MIGFACYMIAVVVGLMLFWKYKRKSPENPNSSGPATHKDDYLTYRISYKPTRPSLLAILGLQETRKPFFRFEDHFRSYKEVSRACLRAGLESSRLIIGVDFTASNEWQGRKSFNGNNLHKITTGKMLNPYQKVITILGETLQPFDSNNLIAAFGFGDSRTKGDSVFSFSDSGSFCNGFSDVLTRYNNIVPKIQLSGPSNFAPVIHRSIELVRDSGDYTILVIIADGQVTVTEEQETINAIVEASEYPLSVIMVGVGDGPWTTMSEFDNHLPDRKFDNFQFVNYHQVISGCKAPDLTFALHALMEIPDQYKTIKSLGYLKK